MLGCGSRKCCKSDEKVEAMASWLILGGFIPLALSFVTHQGAGVTFYGFTFPWYYPYAWAIAMGVASLSVKRTGRLWQFIVFLGMGGFLTTLAVNLANFSEAEIPNIAWAVAVLLLVAVQYRYDMKNYNKKTVDPGVAIVTGASSGIGLVTAKTLARAGYRVFGTSRKAKGETIDGITMLPCDVTDDTSVQKMVDAVLAQAGRIDLLVNNAGVALVGAAEESSINQAQSLFNVNVFGILRATNAVLPTMRSQGRGRIVNISSVLGFIPAPYNALYAATKHAVEGYSESLDHELRTFGIRSVLVEPAYTRTSIGENIPKADQTIAVYDVVRTNMESLMNKGVSKGDDPEIVADTILEAATDIWPKLRYTAGKQARQLRIARRFFSEDSVDKAIRKFNQLPIIGARGGCC